MKGRYCIMIKNYMWNKFKNINKFFNKIDKTFFIGCIFGAFVFIFIYGFKVLNFTYDDWLMKGGVDLTQHYIGWRFFRNSNWHFPIGLMDNITYPNKISVIYMDAIPLFAIIFKLLSPILPKTFQYFGLWGIVCFMLQGGIGSLIVKKFSKDSLVCGLASLFFIISPIMIDRTFWHSALAGHWIILLALYVWLNRNYFNTLVKKIAIWSILMMIASSVHLYFIPMIVIIMVGYLIQEYLENKDVIEVLGIFFIPIFLGIFILFILGAFVGNVNIQSTSLGYFSTNLNSIVNPQDWSKYLKNLDLASSLQYEGFGYLGLGVIILFFISIYISINNRIEKAKTLYNKGYIISATVIVISAYLLAVSYIVTWGKNTLFTISYPNFIINLLSIFRSTGRFIWIVCYLIIIFTIINLVINSHKKTNIIILIICSVIQVSDIHEILLDKNRKFDTIVKYDSNLKSNIWEELVNKGYKNIVMMNNKMIDNRSDLWSISKYAVDNNMSINNCYFARKDLEAINNTILDYIKDLENNIVKDKTIYLFYNTSPMLKDKYPLNCYYVDNFVIGLNERLDNLQEYDYISQRLFSNETDIYSYLDKLSNPDYITIISARDEFSSKLDDEILKKLKNLGFKSDLKDKYRWSYIGVINSGSVIHEELKNDKINFNTQIDDLKIGVFSAGANSENKSSIYIDNREYSQNLRGLNIVVYSKKIGRVVDSVCFDTYKDLKAYR